MLLMQQIKTTGYTSYYWVSKQHGFQQSQQFKIQVYNLLFQHELLGNLLDCHYQQLHAEDLCWEAQTPNHALQETGTSMKLLSSVGSGAPMCWYPATILPCGDPFSRPRVPLLALIIGHSLGLS